MLLWAFYELETDNFRFKPEVRGPGKILLIQANSVGPITLVGPEEVLLWVFDRKCVGGAQIL